MKTALIQLINKSGGTLLYRVLCTPALTTLLDDEIYLEYVQPLNVTRLLDMTKKEVGHSNGTPHELLVARDYEVKAVTVADALKAITGKDKYTIALEMVKGRKK
jgi:hypothetical protein